MVGTCAELFVAAVDGGGTTDADWLDGDDRPVLGGPAIFIPPGGGGKRPGVPPMAGFGRGLDAV